MPRRQPGWPPHTCVKARVPASLRGMGAQCKTLCGGWPPTLRPPLPPTHPPPSPGWVQVQGEVGRGGREGPAPTTARFGLAFPCAAGRPAGDALACHAARRFGGRAGGTRQHAPRPCHHCPGPCPPLAGSGGTCQAGRQGTDAGRSWRSPTVACVPTNWRGQRPLGPFEPHGANNAWLHALHACGALST